MSVYETLVEAIRSGRSCTIGKPGEPDRGISPYRIGDGPNGGINVLYYQYEGYSQRGLQGGGASADWRCNNVDDLDRATINSDPFAGPTVKPKTRGSCVKAAHIEVGGYY